VIIVDNYHKVASEATGDNYHLNLDGILYLGGVKNSMYHDLPSPLLSEFGFQVYSEYTSTYTFYIFQVYP
jgi:hypothetical protein